jgi:hypothetical protein
MGHFEPYVPLSVLYPFTFAQAMSDSVTLLIANLPDDSREAIQLADDAVHAGLATNYSSADRQIKFSVDQARDIVSLAISDL